MRKRSVGLGRATSSALSATFLFGNPCLVVVHIEFARTTHMHACFRVVTFHTPQGVAASNAAPLLFKATHGQLVC